MSLTVLITGFGPFPGAPLNPTQPLARELARRRHPAFANVRRLAHVFRVSYEAVDRELRARPHRLLRAARSTGLPAALSRDAGQYLCNYLCWRAAEAARAGAPRITCFIHVPPAQRTPVHWPRPPRFSFDALAGAGEAIVRAAVMAVRSFI